MTFQEFLEKYNGRYVDFDGAYGAQCMDLLHQYCVEVLGITDGRVLAAPAARDVYNNFSFVKGNELFDQIGNTPTGIPQEGDIVFWGSAPYGHVAIFVTGDANRFKSFDQNYPTGSPCHVQDHTYANVLGWLRFKGQHEDQTLIDQLRADRDKNWNLYQQEQQAKIQLEDAVASKQKTIDTLTKENLDLKEKLESVTYEKNSLSGSLQEVKRELDSKTVALSVCEDRLANRKDLAKYTSRELMKELFSRFHI